jgi:hypothetical protein
MVMVAMPVMRPGLCEVAIEYPLLVGRQHSANLAETLPENLMPIVIKILPRLHHLEPRIAQDVTDSVALRRRQI